jgi:hypothetical protein
MHNIFIFFLIKINLLKTAEILKFYKLSTDNGNNA